MVPSSSSIQGTAEELRLEALASYDVIDTPPEQDLDDIARLAAQICATPVALVTLVDGRRQVFKARFGFEGTTSDLETGFCPLVVRREAPLTIADTLADPGHADNVATREGGVRFYAGVPLTAPGGFVLGTLCVLDVKPRELSDEQHSALAALARQVMRQLELRAALRREREGDVRHRHVLNGAVEHAIVAADLKGRVVEWNEGAGRLLGWSPEEAIGEPVARLIRTVDRDADWFEADAERTLRRGPLTAEEWHRRRSGADLWANRTMSPLKGEDGQVTGYVVVMRDRTEERRREQRLAILSEAAAKLLVADDPEAVLGSVVSESASLLAFQHAYSHVVFADGKSVCTARSVGIEGEATVALDKAIFESTLCSVVARTRAPVIVPDVSRSEQTNIEDARKAGLSSYAGFPVMAGDRLFGVLSFGSLRVHAFDAQALSFFATLARYVAVVRERLDREASLKALAQTLEQRVEERTAELRDAEAALRQSQKLEAVGQLTGGVAHDFNNLLTVLKSSVDLLRKPNLAEERRRRYLDAISDTVDRAAKLTGQLLAFARRQALKPEVFDAAERVRAVSEMLDSVTGSRIRVSLDLSAEPCHVRADASQFETALVNMAVNARDAMDGEGTLTLRVHDGGRLPPIRGHAGSAAAFVAVSLTDTGTGIPADRIGQIFEPFFTTKGVGKGTGLGLSQVFGFAKQSGGDVDVSSEVGRGTTFTLYLPYVPAPEATDAGARRKTAVAGGGRRVLVVEDNVEIGRFATQLLDDLGYQSHWAANADEALARLATPAHEFDVVFSDVVMPGMNGVDLAREIRRRHPALPVVLTSGYSHVLAEEGPQGFDLVHKPYSAEQLSRALRRATSG
ncbi:GAF domain-containing protein [Lichenibacterium dinghuense]|uniref:GAF domain-containing protein n=1 Tax=Lichenibacterium dinghuense TaxID=2895977 RepID=UPI002107A3F1|nr:GAF domain-containing protein [Lichenibacterium sp. 6Y81]